nr:exported protein A EppA [Borreliella bissettiae]
MKKIGLLLFLIFNLNAYIDIDELTEERKEHNFAKAKKTFSKEDFDLLNKRLDNYDFANEYDKSVFFAYAPIIRGRLRKIGIKEKSVFLDAIDTIGDFI